MDKYLEECIDEFNKMKSLLDLRIDNMGECIADAMMMVEKYKDLSGVEKRSLAVKVVSVVLSRHSGVSSEAVEVFEHMGPSMVDTIVKASKGELKINVRSLFKKLFVCILNMVRLKKN